MKIQKADVKYFLFTIALFAILALGLYGAILIDRYIGMTIFVPILTIAFLHSVVLRNFRKIRAMQLIARMIKES